MTAHDLLHVFYVAFFVPWLFHACSMIIDDLLINCFTSLCFPWLSRLCPTVPWLRLSFTFPWQIHDFPRVSLSISFLIVIAGLETQSSLRWPWSIKQKQSFSAMARYHNLKQTQKWKATAESTQGRQALRQPQPSGLAPQLPLWNIIFCFTLRDCHSANTVEGHFALCCYLGSQDTASRLGGASRNAAWAKHDCAPRFATCWPTFVGKQPNKIKCFWRGGLLAHVLMVVCALSGASKWHSVSTICL
jgi:hypothetical protein